MSDNQPNVLVTGGAGFIGSHLADYLISRGDQVVVLDDLSGGFRENVPSEARFVEGSILDVALVDELFDECSFERVYHLAAYAAEGLSHFIKRFNYQNNLIGSVNLINASVRTKVRHFVFTSSIAVYGDGESPLREDMQPEPEDPYGIAKLSVEKELKVTQAMFGLPYTVFRPHNVYGERQNIADRYRNVVGIFMNQILRGEPMTIFGDGLQKRAFTYVDDIIPAMADCPSNPRARNEIFNLGSEEPYTVLDLATSVAEAFATDCSVNHLEERNEVKIAFADESLSREVFGIIESTPLKEGIQRMAEWVQAHGPREPSTFENIELHQGLPPSWRDQVS